MHKILRCAYRNKLYIGENTQNRTIFDILKKNFIPILHFHSVKTMI
ncbi:hypothetical protein AAJ76_790001324 [Vairimorpha ceranae]|uniref:Uncharacterized protein n=1 Tax=Vairimorpha ceranae TaxID=40302 RepID=A0A0F9WBZ5_9MICR|nr:hypothetical protein AAJ76_790001324 [Vairimorpha ceranae]KKO74360.1 hypothetical protein AAJ76_790001324 [Vairimorpha ceranae]